MSLPTWQTGIIKRYRQWLPDIDDEHIVCLNEGSTPLIELVNLPEHINAQQRIWVKFEGLNPTGSFKDRGMTMAVSHAKAKGAKAIMCASTGNTSAAAAAYAARAGMACFVIIPTGKIAYGKLAQALVHGAKVIQIEGNFDVGMEIVKSLATQLPIELVNSVNPYRLEGQKTAAFEIIDTLGRSPDIHALPVGNAGNISAYWMGYSDYLNAGLITNRPRMFGYQAANAAPLALNQPCPNPETVATAIRIGNPQSSHLAKAAVSESNGQFATVTDEEILAAQKLLAATEGVFCEPASAASIAGIINDIRDNKLPKGAHIVCTLTGHGLKDPDVAIEQCKEGITSVTGTLDAVYHELKRHL